MENLYNKNPKELKIYFYKWISILEKTYKKEATNLFVYGLYNKRTKENVENEDLNYEKLKKNISSSSIIYERLCLGVRYIELIILRNENEKDYKIEINEEKKEIYCLFEGIYVYNIYDIFQEIIVFIHNKNEKIILSFLENNEEVEKLNYENRSITYFRMNRLDTNIYLYLRKYLNYSINEGNCKILYFYNNKERIINLSKYNFDIDNFKIRNWVFNNISFLLPSKIVQKNEQKEHNNFLSIDNKQKSSLKLVQHHLSLFRLNSTIEEESSNLSSKILVNRKLPNILIHGKEYNDYNIKSDNYTIDNPSKNNSILYYLEYSNNEFNNATFHKVPAYDSNLNVHKKFIGYNNIPLTEYIIDIPKKMKLKDSPFVFTSKNLIYLYEHSYKNNILDKVDDTNYYVLKIEKENIENVLLYIRNNINIKNIKNFISILETSFDIDHVTSILKFNLKYIMNN